MLKSKLVKFPSTNQPVKCPDCSVRGRKQEAVFIPKYNMMEHYKQEHELVCDEESAQELKNTLFLTRRRSKWLIGLRSKVVVSWR